MGCDGGTIPKRDELVKTKKRPEQKDKTSELSFRWQHCAITQQPLEPPIVSCEMGRLYNKESIIETLLDKSEDNKLTEVAPHVRVLKDVKELALTANPDFNESSRGESGDGYIDVQKSRWICPVSGVEMNGRFRFCFLWTCGCAFSEKALKEMMKLKEEGNECPKCQKLFRVLDIVLLNPTEDYDVSMQQDKMDIRRQLAKDAKKAKKRSKTTAETVTTPNESSSGETTVKVEEKSEKLKNSSSSETPSTSKKSKIIPPTKPPVMGAAGTSSYSVAKDPKASEVYKSLFTTHKTAVNQEKAHWITYNPFYN